jgi:prepilin-type N-terminal cleavage/methylation domain-containing protein
MIVTTASVHHNPAAMQQRTVGRLCQTPIDWSSAFHRNALQRSHQTPAFTLIELLVVIAIIAILIGLLFPAFRAVQDQAKRTQTKNDLTQIVNAVNAYYTDYGRYPPATDDTPIVPNSDLFYTLRAIALGSWNTGNAANPRQIVFISPPFVKDGTNPRSGIAPDPDGKYYDPWGKPYKVEIDTGYDNQIPNPHSADTGAGPVTLNIGVIAWSGGKDGLAPPDSGATTNFNNSDDVISWQ